MRKLVNFLAILIADRSFAEYSVRRSTLTYERTALLGKAAPSEGSKLL